MPIARPQEGGEEGDEEEGEGQGGGGLAVDNLGEVSEGGGAEADRSHAAEQADVQPDHLYVTTWIDVQLIGNISERLMIPLLICFLMD